MITPEALIEIKKFNKNCEWLRSQQLKKKEWAKVSAVRKLTGMSREELRRARDKNVIEFKKDSSGIWYNILSIPDHMKKATA